MIQECSLCFSRIKHVSGPRKQPKGKIICSRVLLTGSVLYRLARVAEGGVGQAEGPDVVLARGVEDLAGPVHLRDANKAHGRDAGQHGVVPRISGAGLPKVEDEVISVVS